MFKVTRHLEKEGETGTLKTSFRSRPSLVNYVNDTFKCIFPSQNIESENVILKAKREEDLNTPALESWIFSTHGNSIKHEFDELAQQISKLLKEPDLHPVIDRTTKQKRPIRPDDIAVLAQSNDQCNKIAESLKRIHIDVERETLGILKEPEVELALAGLKLMMRPDDTLSAARITFFHHVFIQSGCKDTWLTERISEYRMQRGLASSEKSKHGAWVNDPMLIEIRNAGKNLRLFSPSEALQTAMELTKAFTFAGQCKSARKRIGNLEKLLNHARDYESEHLDIDGSATTSGFLIYLEQLVSKKLDTQAIAGSGAVTVSTWHKSKGLEWNMVILYSLNSALKDDFFGVSSASDEEIDVTDPLKNRSIHFFPHPYHSSTKNSAFFDQLYEIDIYNDKKINTIHEKTRLFYVLFTRARDYLIFTAQKDKTKALTVLQSEDGTPFTIPQDTPDKATDWRVISLKTPTKKDDYVLTPDTWYTHAPVLTTKQKASYSPSMLKIPEGFQYEKKHANPVNFSEKLVLKGKAKDNVIGDAVHLYLGVDKSESGPDEKKKILNRILQRMDLINVLPSEDLITQCDAFELKIKELWPNSVIYREWPISFEVNGRSLSGSIDLLLEVTDGWIIIDHKSYHGSEREASNHALDYIPQMTAYAEAVTLASQKQVIGTYINFILLGFLQELKIENRNEIIETALSL